MRILYGVQGTGNGHLSRSIEVIRKLRERGQVEVLVSGVRGNLEIPIKVDHHRNGIGFVSGSQGGIRFVESFRKSRLRKLFKEIRQLNVSQYDLIVSDFEPVTAWACQLKGVPCMGLSNQAALMHHLAPKPASGYPAGRKIIEHYAPCKSYFGLAYESFAEQVYTPIIRQSIRNMRLSDEGHVTVYLPAYSDQLLIKHLNKVKGVVWEVFSKESYRTSRKGNVMLRPLHKLSFEESLSSSNGVITAAGFGTTTEALFMGKKLLVIPQRNQYEQACNAEAISNIGVKVVGGIERDFDETVKEWLVNGKSIKMNYPVNTEQIIQQMIATNHLLTDPYLEYMTSGQYAT